MRLTLGIVASSVSTTGTPPAPPDVPDISYDEVSYEFTVDEPVTTVSPINDGGAASLWSIAPALPAGLVFSRSTGSIYGTPTESCEECVFTITAINATGSSTFNLTINISISGTTFTLIADYGSVVAADCIVGTSNPSSGLGNDGDWYYKNGAGIPLWVKVAGSWEFEGVYGPAVEYQYGSWDEESALLQVESNPGDISHFVVFSVSPPEADGDFLEVYQVNEV